MMPAAFSSLHRSSRAAALLLLLAAMLAPQIAQARTHHHARHHSAARHVAVAAPSAPGQSMILVDNETGLVLAQSNSDTPLHPASLTKAMTLLLTFEALESGRLRIRDSVPVSAHAADMMPSKIGLRPGQSMAAEDAIYAVAVHSANDIAVALAEKIGGSELNFVAMMNRRAGQLGMTHTHFINANGLPNPVQVSSARDMAILARTLIQAHPREYRYFSTRTFIYHGTVYQNHNHLMETYRGMDGLKTGFIQQSGFNLVASAHRRDQAGGDRRLIGVIFGGRSTAARNAQMAALLDWGFAHDDAIIAAARQRAAQAAAQAQAAAPIHYPTGSAGPYVAAASAPPASEGDSDAAADTRAAAVPASAAPAQTATPQATAFQAASQVAPQVVPQAAAPAAGQSGTGIAPASDWAIQLGAFDSPAKGQALLATARTRLPAALQGAQDQSMPLQTANGWLYRARLTGYSQSQAFSACQLLADCVPVPPAR